MNEPRNALSARDSHVWSLRMALVFVFFVSFGLLAVIYSKQNDFFVHVPPDLSQGSKIKPGELQAPNSYSFASYVWRGLNEWSVLGKTDYMKNIEKFSCNVSPTFLVWIKANEKQKSAAGELGRTRTLSIDDPYAVGMSSPIGDNTFNVSLTTTIHERIDGISIKDISVRYPLRVVPDTRSCNLFGMALDGFYEQPERTESEHVLVEKK